jgi:hypothetical protein
MKTIVKLVASTLLISSAFALSPAYADATPSSAAMSKEDANRSMNVDKHIAKLHEKLKITPDEESQWAVVVDAMHNNANDMDYAIDKREGLRSDSTAIADLDAYGDIAQAHADGIRNLSAAFAPLYDSMSYDQKKIADEVFLHRMQNGKHMHRASN